MDFRISATHLARRLGDVLRRIRSRGDSFTVERHGTPVARIGPVEGASRTTVRAATAAEIPSKVAEVMRLRGVVRASMFGSAARGEASPVSDVDFLVEFEQGRTLLDLTGLGLDLKEALGCDVDVATPNSLHPALEEEIMRDLVPIHISVTQEPQAASSGAG